MDSILGGGYRPSKKLLEHVADSIQGHEPWRLLDEQLVVHGKILADIETARQNHEKRIIIVAGGPGTGKSVVALQVVGAAARRGYNVAHATGSKAFTTNLRGIVGRSEPFRYWNEIRKAAPNSIDLIVSDEAHRLRAVSTDWRGRPVSDCPQIQEVVNAANVSVFLLDGQQSVKANEIGTVPYIEAYARLQQIPVSYYELSTQFRCAGSDSYVRWIDYVLSFSQTRSLAWKTNDEYEVRVFDDIQELENTLKKKISGGNSARMVAGFCWKWSDPRLDGSLVPDVTLGPWARP